MNKKQLNILKKDTSGNSALFLAAGGDQPELVAELLQHKAALKQRGSGGELLALRKAGGKRDVWGD